MAYSLQRDDLMRRGGRKFATRPEQLTNEKRAAIARGIMTRKRASRAEQEALQVFDAEHAREMAAKRAKVKDTEALIEAKDAEIKVVKGKKHQLFLLLKQVLKQETEKKNKQRRESAAAAAAATAAAAAAAEPQTTAVAITQHHDDRQHQPRAYEGPVLAGRGSGALRHPRQSISQEAGMMGGMSPAHSPAGRGSVSMSPAAMASYPSPQHQHAAVHSPMMNLGVHMQQQQQPPPYHRQQDSYVHGRGRGGGVYDQSGMRGRGGGGYYRGMGGRGRGQMRGRPWG